MTTPTQIEAYEGIKPHLNELQERVLKIVENAGPLGLAPFEVIEQSGLYDYTARPRLSELKKLGLIKANGNARRNSRGNNETVFVAVEESQHVHGQGT